MTSHLPPGVPVRGPSARMGPTVSTRAAGLYANACQASVAPSARNCSVSTLWTVTLTFSSPTYRTGLGPTSLFRCVSGDLVTQRESGSRASPLLRMSGYTPRPQEPKGTCVERCYPWVRMSHLRDNSDRIQKTKLARGLAHRP